MTHLVQHFKMKQFYFNINTFLWNFNRKCWPFLNGDKW